ncbi:MULTISPECIES: Lrp/AsnC family transcriptional regulator [Vibrio]|uniref:Lrp/AsnC family transcriptional regulator n=1 Tax=Vibrio TaxID=662 RepID=UPI00155FE2BA|nr:MULTISPECIES: Lrp/AsnC family transcriptional regulator [Vibrio]MCC2521975.1 Lrp/AsnC family transcriptional regulator [Vibrio coralliilyticus]NRF30549.1 Lrp/AsnC family transcriptional regulator [Vibrio coralliilyticus]NRF53754.1 Lrp/AsnC family transcriptional regulator [Vibrio coralliilyticus]NRG04992.1 Lrp/AsnC family transcriptional regulator [Vibrio coralliilyticus]WFB50403.1 Lrp/AsnC family transcriptional regulator [Vibrio coralliilyticus]
MDKFDNQILDILRRHARASVSDIARQVNLSRSAVTARIQKLEQEKVILGYHANIAQDEPDLIQAYMALKFDMSASSHYCESYAETIYKIDGVKWCHAITGETDMMLFVEVPTMARLNEIRDELQTIPELRHLMTHTVLTEFFNTRHVS